MIIFNFNWPPDPWDEPPEWMMERRETAAKNGGCIRVLYSKEGNIEIDSCKMEIGG